MQRGWALPQCANTHISLYISHYQNNMSTYFKKPCADFTYVSYNKFSEIIRKQTIKDKVLREH